MATQEFMVTMPHGQEPGHPMEARSPDGQTMKFEAPRAKAGVQFPVAYTVGGRGGAPPVDTDLMMAMHGVLRRYEVSRLAAKDLLVLKSYDLILLVDDSGSMKRTDPGCNRSRWMELKDALGPVIATAGCFNKSGLDVYFLNREKIQNVVTPEDENFKQSMLKPPYGSTPMTQMVETIVHDRERSARIDNSLIEKPVLLMIFTDGEPDDGPARFGKVLRSVLKRESTKLKFRCQIMACTGCDEEVEWLKKLDDELDELDVTDDYMTEKIQAERCAAGTFSRGDWLMKAMLGGIHAKYDCLNEVNKRPHGSEDLPDTKRQRLLGPDVPQRMPEEVVPRNTNVFLHWFLLVAVLAGLIYIYFALNEIAAEFRADASVVRRTSGTATEAWTPAK